MTEQLKKDRYGWSDEAEKAFKKLKEAMTTVPVLAMPNFNKPFIIETHASGFGLRAVLMQENRPIAYYSFTLGKTARLKSIYEKELMAIVRAILKWRAYLLGRKFIVRTDQKSLKHILEQRLIGSDYQRWVTKLMGYDFEVQYQTGASNRVADALSRKEPTITCNSVSVGYWKFWGQLKEELDKDEFIQRVKKDLEVNAGSLKDFVILQGNLLFKGKLVIPAASPLIPEIISTFHDSYLGGHSGEKKTHQRTATKLFWVGMKAAIADYIKKCVVCQQHKTQNTSPAGLLQPIALPRQTWDEISMDFVEGLPKSENWDTIWVVVDRLSKYSHFIPLKHPFTAATVANKFMTEIVRLHGLPLSIISDRDRIFLSHFWVELFRLHRVDLKPSTAYHPQSDGQTEVVNRCLETYYLPEMFLF